MPTNPKPTSSKKSATARANGAKSHGPTTDAGLARSSRNATRHGLAAEFTRGAVRRRAALPPVSLVLADESAADFQRLLNAYLDEFAPTSPLEAELVETMASARWRLRRLANIETTLLTNEMQTSVEDVDRFFGDADLIPEPDDRLACAFKSLAGGASLHLLNRYEGTINRSYAQAFKQLHLLRSLRIRVQPNEPKKSLRSLPVEPQATGQSHKIHTESSIPPITPHQIPAPATQRATIEVSPRINDQHLHS